MVDFDALESASKRMDADPDAEMSVLALKGDAVKILKDVLLNADSDDVKRKAAVDVLNFSKASNVTKPAVTEEQLEYLGRVIVETEAIRVGVGGS
jgi:hypothetical protein